MTHYKKVCSVLAALALVAIIIYGALYNHREFKEEMIAQARKQLQLLVFSEARAVEENLSHIYAHMQIMAQNSLMQEMMKKKKTGFESTGHKPGDSFYIAHKDMVRSFYWFDNEGICLCNQPIVKDRMGRDFSQRLDVSYVLQHHKALPSILTPEYTLCGKSAISLCVPVMSKDDTNKEELVGILCSHICLDALKQRIDHITREGKAHVVIKNSDDSIICVTHEEQRDLDHKKFASKLIVAEYPIRVLDQQWHMGIAIAYEDIAGPITKNARNTCTGLGFVLLLFGGLGYGFHRMQRKKALFQAETKHLRNIAHATEALKESETRFRELFQHMDSGVGVYEAKNDGEDFLFRDINRAAEEIDGIEREKVVGKSVCELFPAIKAFGLFEIFQEVWRTGNPMKHPVRLYKDDRLLGWRKNFVYKLPSGEVVTIYSDETERMRAELALEKSEAQKQSILDASIDVILYTDKKMRIIWANKMAGKVLNKNPENLIGHTCHMIYVNSDMPCHGCPCNKALESGNIEQNVMYQQSMNVVGESYWENYCVPVKDKNGHITGVIKIARNITDRKKDEKALYAALEKAEESDRLKSAFLANISHEIRTPLNPILGYTNLMLEETPSEDHKQYLQVIQNSVHLLLSILNDILDLSQIEADQIEIEQIPVSLRTLFSTINATAAMCIAQRHKDITLRESFPDTISEYIISDPTRLQQVLCNLMNNAVKFTESGYIEYGVSLKDVNRLEFYVRDTGIGIPKDKHEEIYKPFHQIDVSHTRKYGGSGLGLTICKKLITLMGGEIRVISNVGSDHGTTIYFILPYNPISIKPAKDREKTNILETKASYTVLIVEDDISNQQLIMKILERAGYKVAVSNDGKEAISIYKSDPSIDLILMDIQMPVLDGIEATKAIRNIEAQQRKNTRIPIIALTACVMEDDRNKCIDAGCDGYVSKPINLNALKTTLKKYL